MNKLLLILPLLSSLSALAQLPVYNDFDVDSAARPKAGMSNLYAFLHANLRKPILAEANGISGRVIISGVVEPDGHLTSPTIRQSLRPDCDREALRVLPLFSGWKPALKNGQPVRQVVTLPVIFRPNPPFHYTNGARISYFDADSKPLSDSSDLAHYKQVMPLDTNGLPAGDLVVYQRKRADWKEYNRLKFVHRNSTGQNSSRKSTYEIGHLDVEGQWQGDVYSLTEAGMRIRQVYYTNGRNSGPELTYYDNGVVAEQKEVVEGGWLITTWYPTGQIKQSAIGRKPIPSSISGIDQVTAFWDSTGQQSVVDGNGRAFYTRRVQSKADTTRRTIFSEQGAYEGGLKHGIWMGRYADGSYFYQEQYERGLCQSGKARTASEDTLRYTIPEKQPEFAGGMPGLGQFLMQNLRYPAEAQRARIQGKVFVSFVVCTDGTLCDYEVIKHVDPTVDQEALRVVKAMSGRWTPGVQRGRKVRVKYNLPINFTLQ